MDVMYKSLRSDFEHSKMNNSNYQFFFSRSKVEFPLPWNLAVEFSYACLQARAVLFKRGQSNALLKDMSTSEAIDGRLGSSTSRMMQNFLGMHSGL